MGDAVQHLMQSGAGIDNREPMGTKKVNPWAKGKTSIMCSSAITPLHSTPHCLLLEPEAWAPCSAIDEDTDEAPTASFVLGSACILLLSSSRVHSRTSILSRTL